MKIEQCGDSRIIRYHESQSGENLGKELRQREDRIIASEMSIPSLYCEFGLMSKTEIYLLSAM